MLQVWIGVDDCSQTAARSASQSGTCQPASAIFSIQSATMKVRVLYDRPESNPDCGTNDLKPQRAIWETATFTRVS